MKNGLFIEDGVPTYYEDDKPVHKGIVKDGDDIYYIGKDGKAERGHKIVHKSMTHHIVKHGTYKFGDDYKMIKGYYKPAKKRSSHKSGVKGLFKSYSKSNKKDAKSILKLSVALLSLFAVVVTMSAVLNLMSDSDEAVNAPKSESLFYISVPEIQDEVWLVTESAKQVYNGEADMSILSGNYPYQPFYFSYGITCFDITQSPNLVAKLYLSENENMENSAEYELDTTVYKAVIDNLKVDTTYYYRLEAALGEEKQSVSGSFKTAATNRFLNIPNLSNVRDIGGLKTLDGRKIKQDLVIRGTEADGLVVADYFLTDEYIGYAREHFGFKYDMDLRSELVGYPGYISRFGEDVKHEFLDSPMYGGTISEINWSKVNKIFSTFANSENYPMYVHCTYGKDRTGTMIYLLEAILGVSDEDKLFDYNLSKDADDVNIEVMLAALQAYSGDTINEKVVSFLTQSAGITPEQIESIRNIMLTE